MIPHALRNLAPLRHTLASPPEDISQENTIIQGAYQRRDVRATLNAAANALLMRTMAGSQIKSWGMRLIRTKGRRRAVVAVARKLAVLLHRMWIDGTEFRQEPVGGMA